MPVRIGVVLMDPGLAEDVNGGDLASPAWSRFMIESAEQLYAIGAHLFGISIALDFTLGSAGCLDACAIALKPVDCHLWAEPSRGHDR